MKVDTIKGSSYVMTCTKACTVSAIFNSGETSMLILEAGEKGTLVTGKGTAIMEDGTLLLKRQIG